MHQSEATSAIALEMCASPQYCYSDYLRSSQLRLNDQLVLCTLLACCTSAGAECWSADESLAAVSASASPCCELARDALQERVRLGLRLLKRWRGDGRDASGPKAVESDAVLSGRATPSDGWG